MPQPRPGPAWRGAVDAGWSTCRPEHPREARTNSARPSGPATRTSSSPSSGRASGPPPSRRRRRRCSPRPDHRRRLQPDAVELEHVVALAERRQKTQHRQGVPGAASGPSTAAQPLAPRCRPRRIPPRAPRRTGAPLPTAAHARHPRAAPGRASGPVAMAATAGPTCAGRPSSRGTSLPVPAGITPRAVGVPATASTPRWTVPSPPTTTRARAPALTASAMAFAASPAVTSWTTIPALASADLTSADAAPRPPPARGLTARATDPGAGGGLAVQPRGPVAGIHSGGVVVRRIGVESLVRRQRGGLVVGEVPERLLRPPGPAPVVEPGDAHREHVQTDHRESEGQHRAGVRLARRPPRRGSTGRRRSASPWPA